MINEEQLLAMLEETAAEGGGEAPSGGEEVPRGEEKSAAEGEKESASGKEGHTLIQGDLFG